MNPKVDLVFKLLKKLLIWLVAPLAFVVFLFFLGEQYEVGRLSAVASCEGSVNTPACIRSKGYLASEPYYPDLGRRYIGGFARMVGGDLGASYRVEPKLPALAPKPADSPEEDDDLKDLPPEKPKAPAPPPTKAPAKI
ncbi:MAG: hypothetical protein ACKOXA_06840 [Polynucleobacter sp.]|mgnify:FL=1|jgi:hypothetical protein|uniref:hypothetical protein n=1 Tax=Polynucleobacter sp. MWH-UH24A TaxID=2689110 RepID=UPI001BFE3C5B|nr:hypothetical protein [Polynucleobacter sp. MWH-UH24A]MBM3348769.1 hypothetical protein [Betaproteobacteria bacterium]MBU3726311.1 hypothetical protein [Polynucleobacter sp.]NCV94578.1 hypothetical protein [Burkholderiaceae bacterium]NCY11775.1 hypothetical protein [Burkholderiaceae bacterium]NCZ80094.1 hypothetical protein [Burkholderiaceae bacterium]